MVAESRQCPRCGCFDTLKPLDDLSNDAKWSSLDGQRFGVKQLRCVACGLSDLIERDVARLSREAPDPAPGEAVASDGRMFVAHPLSEPVDEPGA